jgi:predicted DNA-binding protein (MmcQ/YjbR family)
MVEYLTSDSLREFCPAPPQATETYPFGEETSDFTTSGNDKISALESDSLDVSLKCDPEESLPRGLSLRGSLPAVT